MAWAWASSADPCQRQRQSCARLTYCCHGRAGCCSSSERHLLQKSRCHCLCWSRCCCPWSQQRLHLGCPAEAAQSSSQRAPAGARSDLYRPRPCPQQGLEMRPFFPPWPCSSILPRRMPEWLSRGCHVGADSASSRPYRQQRYPGRRRSPRPSAVRLRV